MLLHFCCQTHDSLFLFRKWTQSSRIDSGAKLDDGPTYARHRVHENVLFAFVLYSDSRLTLMLLQKAELHFQAVVALLICCEALVSPNSRCRCAAADKLYWFTVQCWHICIHNVNSVLLVMMVLPTTSSWPGRGPGRIPEAPGRCTFGNHYVERCLEVFQPPVRSVRVSLHQRCCRCWTAGVEVAWALASVWGEEEWGSFAAW